MSQSILSENGFDCIRRSEFKTIVENYHSKRGIRLWNIPSISSETSKPWDLYSGDRLEAFENDDTFGSEFLRGVSQGYESLVSDKSILLHDGGEQFLRLPYVHRGSKEYRNKIRNKFHAIARNFSGRSVIFLTVSPRGAGSPYSSFLQMKELMNPFMSWIQERMGYRPRYVWSFEPTQRGYPHFHMVLEAYLLPEPNDIVGWFKSKGMDIGPSGVELKRVTKNHKRQVVAYLMKYISKQVENPEWAGLLFLTKLRSWSCSRSLGLSPTEGRLDQFKEKVWIFIGIFHQRILSMVLDHPDNYENPQKIIQDIRSINWYVETDVLFSN